MKCSAVARADVNMFSKNKIKGRTQWTNEPREIKRGALSLWRIMCYINVIISPNPWAFHNVVLTSEQRHIFPVILIQWVVTLVLHYVRVTGPGQLRRCVMWDIRCLLVAVRGIVSFHLRSVSFYQRSLHCVLPHVIIQSQFVYFTFALRVLCIFI